MLKLVAIDLDDTLLRKDKTIPLENLNTLKSIKEHVYVVIASGRPFFRIKPILKCLGLDNSNSWVISFNGSRITNGDETVVLRNKMIEKQGILKINKIQEDINLGLLLYQEEDIYQKCLKEEIRSEKIFQNIKFKPLDDKALNNINYANKMIFTDYSEKIEKYTDYIKNNLADYNILRSTPIFLEVLNKEANKGKALKELLAYLKIDKEDAMAIGDEENDISMLEVVGMKVAVANGTEEIKKHANFITLDHEASGVAYAIKYFLNKESRK